MKVACPKCGTSANLPTGSGGEEFALYLREQDTFAAEAEVRNLRLWLERVSPEKVEILRAVFAAR